MDFAMRMMTSRPTTTAAIGLVLLASDLQMTACPLRLPLPPPRSFVQVDLRYIPSTTPMELLSFYDRASVLELLILLLLFCSAAGALALIIERSTCYARAHRQTRSFLWAAKEAFALEETADLVFLASLYPRSPLANVISVSLIPDRTDNYSFSPSGRQLACAVKVREVARGLTILSGIAMTAPLLGAAAAVEGMMRYLRISSVLFISSDILKEWSSEWLGILLASLSIGFAVVWAHRLLSASANRLLSEMDRLSLALINRAGEIPAMLQVHPHVQTQTRESTRSDTRPA